MRPDTQKPLLGNRNAHAPRPRAPRNPRQFRRYLRGDRGSVSAELVVATPLLLLMLLTIVQFALWSHATHIAQTAASQGLAVARAQNGTAAAGRTSAQQILDQLARGPLADPSVSVDRTATEASIRISGTATALLPFMTLPVHAEVVGPVERFVPNLYEFRNSEAVSGGNRSGGGP
jgi:Flp pilus assembly protein TadG